LEKDAVTGRGKMEVERTSGDFTTRRRIGKNDDGPRMEERVYSSFSFMSTRQERGHPRGGPNFLLRVENRGSPYCHHLGGLIDPAKKGAQLFKKGGGRGKKKGELKICLHPKAV